MSLLANSLANSVVALLISLVVVFASLFALLHLYRRDPAHYTSSWRNVWRVVLDLGLVATTLSTTLLVTAQPATSSGASSRATATGIVAPADGQAVGRCVGVLANAIPKAGEKIAFGVGMMRPDGIFHYISREAIAEGGQWKTGAPLVLGTSADEAAYVLLYVYSIPGDRRISDFVSHGEPEALSVERLRAERVTPLAKVVVHRLGDGTGCS
ncbi:hypothetical protein V5P93_002907 [Actinokineospora auranticolor]|uniref:hypothetical protein n=1 Tax=Actinokineospora auranticolor TaxID=155976 RepID=UPI000CEBA50F|nr:hypothetical protein [Actinokineospora auranticolor]